MLYVADLDPYADEKQARFHLFNLLAEASQGHAAHPRLFILTDSKGR